MDKNEELQKWLNDDRYVRPQELSTIFGKKSSDITYLLKINGVKAKKRFFCANSIGGSFVFYDRCECMKVKSDHDANIDKLNKCFENDSLVTRKQLQSLWGTDAHSVIKRHKIKPVAIFNTGSRGCNFYDRAECERARIFIDNDSILQSYLQNSKYIRISELSIQWNIKEPTVWHFLRKNNIHPATRLKCGLTEYVFYSKDECLRARAKYVDKIREYDNAVKNKEFISNKDMCEEWGWHRHKVGNFLKLQCIFPAKKISVGAGFCAVLYSRAECERARQFINQPEQKEVEKMEEKQMELPKPKEQTPDIIPADTIDLFTMSELEIEFNKRGVELTAEVRNKINASDMPEMQHIATMLRGNTKTIAIRLSVLNEIAGELRNDTLCIVEDSKISMNVHTNDGRIEKYYLNAKLRPCVLCGGDALAVDAEESKNDSWHASVLCCKCGDSSVCADDSNLHDVMDSLIDGWQERHHVGSAPKKKSRKGVGGATSKYGEHFPALAKEYARQGATDKSIAQYLGISQETFYQYLKKYPLFAKALSDGRNANPFDLSGLAGKSASERYLLLIQQQLNDMQKTIEMLVKKLDGVGVVEKKNIHEKQQSG
jgi:hypothetical protein